MVRLHSSVEHPHTEHSRPNTRNCRIVDNSAGGTAAGWKSRPRTTKINDDPQMIARDALEEPGPTASKIVKVRQWSCDSCGATQYAELDRPYVPEKWTDCFTLPASKGRKAVELCPACNVNYHETMARLRRLATLPAPPPPLLRLLRLPVRYLDPCEDWLIDRHPVT